MPSEDMNRTNTYHSSGHQLLTFCRVKFNVCIRGGPGDQSLFVRQRLTNCLSISEGLAQQLMACAALVIAVNIGARFMFHLMWIMFRIVIFAFPLQVPVHLNDSSFAVSSFFKNIRLTTVIITKTAGDLNILWSNKFLNKIMK